MPVFPGGANVTGNITVTMVLALFTFAITTTKGNRNYWLHIFNMPGMPWCVKLPLPLMPVIEIIGMMTKPFVLMIRLFANMTAGHIIVLGFFSLIFIFVIYAYTESSTVVVVLYILDHILFNFAFAIRTFFQKIAHPSHIAPSMAMGAMSNTATGMVQLS